MERQLILPTNWDEALVGRVAHLRPAYLYGSLANEATLRPPTSLAARDEEEIEARVAEARAAGIGVTYVMNATCLGNRELSEDGRWAILQRFEWLAGIGVTGIVTANPIVMELLRESHPELELQISVLAGVDAPVKARFFEDLGATVIHLDPQINRDFRRLAAIRRAVDCRLSVVVNEGCVLSCPIRQYHANAISHSAESIEGRYHVDYCYARCSLARLQEPAEYLKSPWIRPEDLGVYESLGIDHFKLAGREKMGEGPSSHTDWIAACAAAYAERRCDDVAELLVGLQSLATPFGEAVDGPRVRIESRALDGFLDLFRKDGCSLDCLTCDHCKRWAARAVRFEGSGGAYRERLLLDLGRIRRGSYWAGTS